jgi:hypothetical protein
MNGDEAVGNAPCTFCSIGISESGKCERRCLSPCVTLVMIKGITLILLIESRDKILLKGGRL